MPVGRETQEQLRSREGVRTRPYEDHKGNTTVGIGMNLEHPLYPEERAYFKEKYGNPDYPKTGRPLDEQDIQRTFDIRTQKAEEHAKAFAGPVWNEMDHRRQRALIDLAYNVGQTKLRKFTDLQTALKDRNFTGAAREIMDSQAGRDPKLAPRYKEISEMMREGNNANEDVTPPLGQDLRSYSAVGKELLDAPTLGARVRNSNVTKWLEAPSAMMGYPLQLAGAGLTGLGTLATGGGLDAAAEAVRAGRKPNFTSTRINERLNTRMGQVDEGIGWLLDQIPK